MDMLGLAEAGACESAAALLYRASLERTQRGMVGGVGRCLDCLVAVLDVGSARAQVSIDFL